MEQILFDNQKAKQARIKTGLSQSKVARELQMNRGYLCQFENGTRILKDTDLQKLKDFYAKQPAVSEDQSTVSPDSRKNLGTIRYGFMISANSDQKQVEIMLDEIKKNDSRIAALLTQPIPMKGSFLGLLADTVDEDDLAETTQFIYQLMAHNYVLVSGLRGLSELVPNEPVTEPITVGEYLYQNQQDENATNIQE